MGDPNLGELGSAHLKPLDPGTGITSGTPSALLPLAIAKRGGLTFDRPHLVTTMTVGVSLGGKYTDPGGAKRALFLAAALGDPMQPSCPDLSTLKPFEWVPDPTDPTRGSRKPGTIYYFDAANPESLLNVLDKALLAATAAPNTNVAASPNLPFIGASYGREAYLGKFQPLPGAIWKGDLLMFGTRQSGGQTLLVDKNNQPVTLADATTANWSTSKALQSS